MNQISLDELEKRLGLNRRLLPGTDIDFENDSSAGSLYVDIDSLALKIAVRDSGKQLLSIEISGDFTEAGRPGTGQVVSSCIDGHESGIFPALAYFHLIRPMMTVKNSAALQNEKVLP